jgi:WD40 repeat protein
MRKEPDRRYKTASELADDVRKYLSGDPLVAGPESTIYRLKKTVKRHRVVVMAVGTVLIVLVAGIIVSTVFAARALRAERVERSQRIALEHARRAAEKNAEATRRALYFNRIHRADKELMVGETYRAQELLDSCPGYLRNWEWYHLWQRSHFFQPVFTGHRGCITSVAFSQNGKYIVSASRDRTTTVWDAETGSTIAVLRGHRDQVSSVSFIDGGKKVISGSRDASIRLWDIATGKTVKEVSVHNRPISSVACTLDGKQVVAGDEGGTIKVWDVSSGDILSTLTADGPVSGVAVTSDGRYVISGAIRGTVTLWDTRNAIHKVFESDQRYPVTAIDLSPDDKYIAWGWASGRISIWDVVQATEVCSFRASSQINAISFSPDDKFIACGDSSGELRVWDLAARSEVTSFHAHTGSVHSLMFSPDGRTIVSGGCDATVKMWRLEKQEGVRTLSGHKSGVKSITFSPDGNYLASTSASGEVKLWQTDSGTELWDVPTDNRHDDILTFSPDNRHIIVGELGTIHIWNIVDKAVETFHLSNEVIRAATFNPDGQHVLVVSGDTERGENGKVMIVNRTTHESRTILETAPLSCRAVFSPDRRLVVTSATNGTIRVWDSGTGEKVQELRAPDYVTALAFSSDGSRILSGDRTGTVRIWDVKTGRNLTRVYKAFGITSLAFSHDNERLVAGSSDNTITIWDSTTVAEGLTLQARSEVNMLLFSPGGGKLAAACADGIIRIWDTANKEQVMPRFELMAEATVKDMKQYAFVVSKYSNMIAEDPGNADVFNKRGIIYYMNGQYQKALLDFAHAAQIKPEDTYSWHNRGLVYYRNHQYTQAISDLNKAIELDPNNARAYEIRGLANMALERFKSAFSDLTTAADQGLLWLGEDHPVTSFVMNALARCFVSCPNTDLRSGQKALLYATRACELTNWNNYHFIDTLAATYAEIGDFQSAVKWQRIALSMLPEEEVALHADQMNRRINLYGSGATESGGVSRKSLHETIPQMHQALFPVCTELMIPLSDAFEKKFSAEMQDSIKIGLEQERAGLVDQIRLLEARLNGKELDTRNPVIRVTPGQRIVGIARIRVYNWHDSAAVFPVGWTPSWGDSRVSYRSISMSAPPGYKDYTVHVDLQAPKEDGYHFVAFACAAQMSVGNVMSATAWTRRKDEWYDGNDIADLSLAQIGWGIKHGWIPLMGLEPDDNYVASYYGGTAFIVQVDFLPPISR